MARERDRKERAPDSAPRTGRESSAVPGGSFPGDAPGDGSVCVPINREGHHGNRPSRNVALEGDKMQSFVGGGSPKEHEYRDDPTPPDAGGKRRE